MKENNHASIFELLQHLLVKDNIVFVKFTSYEGQLLGSTLLEYTDARGFLIDETQIHPVFGRKKGIMTAYFRKLVPILDGTAPYWTEFIMTAGSAVLRRVLIGELGMLPVSYYPSYYLNPNGGRISNLVAYGPAKKIRVELNNIVTDNRAARELLAVLIDEPTMLQSNVRELDWNRGANQFTMSAVSPNDLDRSYTNHKIVGVLPHEKMFLVAQWPESSSYDMELALKENNNKVTSLVRHVLQ